MEKLDVHLTLLMILKNTELEFSVDFLEYFKFRRKADSYYPVVSGTKGAYYTFCNK